MRALLEDGDIIYLDEATASVDKNIEEWVDNYLEIDSSHSIESVPSTKKDCDYNITSFGVLKEL